MPEGKANEISTCFGVIERDQAPLSIRNRCVMLEDVNDSIIRPHLEEGGIWSKPAFEDLLHNAHVIIEPEAERTFICLTSRIAFHPDQHF